MPKKRGRPPVDDPVRTMLTLRVTREDIARIRELEQKTGYSRSKIMRTGIEKLYKEANENV